MAEPDHNVIEQLRARRERPQRQPPTHRPARGQPAPAVVAAPAPDTDADDRAPAAQAVEPAAPPAEQDGRAGVIAEGVALGPDDPLANFAVRVRRPLDDFVAWRLAELRRHGVRVSKAELTEMLLWELTRDDVAQLGERVAAFRQAAPRVPR